MVPGGHELDLVLNQLLMTYCCNHRIVQCLRSLFFHSILWITQEPTAGRSASNKNLCILSSKMDIYSPDCTFLQGSRIFAHKRQKNGKSQRQWKAIRKLFSRHSRGVAHINQQYLRQKTRPEQQFQVKKKKSYYGEWSCSLSYTNNYRAIGNW